MSKFEHGNLSPWGYIIDTEALPDFLTVQEFNSFTASKFANDPRITANIPSATEAIRNFCGWHIAPNLTCGMLYRVQDLRDAFIGPDLLIQLPATFITSVDKIVIDAKWNEEAEDWDGEIITDPDAFDFGMGGGLLRIYDVNGCDRKAKIFIKYAAGYALTAIPAVKELTANRVTHAVANPYGVNSESAGGVSVSYSGLWASGSSSTALANDAREVLEPYRLKGVF